jgi:hypothetical protein
MYYVLQKMGKKQKKGKTCVDFARAGGVIV